MGLIYKILDNHVHIAGKGDVYKNSLYWSKKFEKGIGFKGLKILKGWSFRRVGDRLMIKTLLKQAKKTKFVDQIVVLAFDNVYEVDGTYRGPGQDNNDNALSTIYVSNNFVMGLCEKNPKLLPGISVHPFRDDAIEELEKHHNRAVLCKWIPSSQMIDLENEDAQPKLIKFYKKLAEINLPLLFHTGVETSIPAPVKGYDKYNDPQYIEVALEMGVTVILAHCGCSFFDILFPQDNVVNEVLKLFEKQMKQGKNWKLYADISALFSPFRKRKILNDIFSRIPASKLIYGSDFPNPAKGRKEFFLRPFLRYRKANLINRYYKISLKWLRQYYSEAECYHLFTNFHRLLEDLGRGPIVRR